MPPVVQAPLHGEQAFPPKVQAYGAQAYPHQGSAAIIGMKVDTGMVLQQKQGHVIAVPNDRLWVQHQKRQATLHGHGPFSEIADTGTGFTPIKAVINAAKDRCCIDVALMA